MRCKILQEISEKKHQATQENYILYQTKTLKLTR